MISLKKISEYIPDRFVKTKEIVRSTEEITSAVAKEVFPTVVLHTVPYIFHAIPLWQPDLCASLIRAAIFSLEGVEGITIRERVAGIALHTFFPFIFLTNSKNAFELIQALAPIAIITELAVNTLFPQSLAVHLIVRGIVLLAGALSSMRSLKQGAYKIHQGLTDSQLKTSEKVAKVFSGLILIGFGAFGLNKAAEASTKLYGGLKAFNKSDSTQQSFALKYHTHESGEEKHQKIDQNYKNTRTYEEKCEELRRLLEQPKNELGKDSDLNAVEEALLALKKMMLIKV